jgi:hypothetical protein
MRKDLKGKVRGAGGLSRPLIEHWSNVSTVGPMAGRRLSIAGFVVLNRAEVV